MQTKVRRVWKKEAKSKGYDTQVAAIRKKNDNGSPKARSNTEVVNGISEEEIIADDF